MRGRAGLPGREHFLSANCTCSVCGLVNYFSLVQECPPGFAYSEDVEDCDVYENIDDCDAEPPVTDTCDDATLTCDEQNEGEFFPGGECSVSSYMPC